MWLDLYYLATSDIGPKEDPPDILISPETPTSVILKYSNGDTAVVRWHHESKQWYFLDSLNICPCDVAARDTL
jgi:hypothetical protein